MTKSIDNESRKKWTVPHVKGVIFQCPIVELYKKIKSLTKCAGFFVFSIWCHVWTYCHFYLGIHSQTMHTVQSRERKIILSCFIEDQDVTRSLFGIQIGISKDFFQYSRIIIIFARDIHHCSDSCLYDAPLAWPHNEPSVLYKHWGRMPIHATHWKILKDYEGRKAHSHIRNWAWFNIKMAVLAVWQYPILEIRRS